jgi:hypothetical protein
MSASSPNGYSPKVEIRLLVAGHKLNVARIGGGQLELRDKIDLPPSDAKVVISVDGRETVTPVVLTSGICSQLEFVEFS